MQTTRLCTLGRFQRRPCARPARRCTELGNRGGCVLEHPFLVLGVDPGPRHDARAVVRPDFVLHRVDQGIERGRVHEAFLDEQRFERLDPECEIRRRILMNMCGLREGLCGPAVAAARRPAPSETLGDSTNCFPGARPHVDAHVDFIASLSRFEQH